MKHFGHPTNVFYQMKSRDTFAPIGPYIVTADEIKDPHKLQIRLTNNGVVMQNFNTDDMAHKIPRCIEWITSIHTLHRCTPATFSQPGPTIEGSIRSWTATTSSSPVRAAARCTSQCAMI
jgi:Fumarylacetoacetate (FAA) hydrolase family